MGNLAVCPRVAPASNQALAVTTYNTYMSIISILFVYANTANYLNLVKY